MKGPCWLVLTICFYMGWACAPQEGPWDASQNSQDSYSGLEQFNAVDDLNIQSDDVNEPTTPLILEVPSNTRLCGVFRENRALSMEHDLLAMIELEPGEYDLHREQDSFPLDIIRAFWFGPDRNQAIAEQAGICYHEKGKKSVYIWHRYLFEQTFKIGTDSVRLALPISFTFKNNNFSMDRFVLDEKTITYPVMEGFLGYGQEESELLHFASCSYRLLDSMVYKFQWQNNDMTVFEQKGINPLAKPAIMSIGYTGVTVPANFVKASVVISGNDREEDDYFKLVYAADHHNWNAEFLMILDPPQEGVYGLYLNWGDNQNLTPPQELYYLGFDLDPDNAVRRSKLSSYEIQEISAE